MTMNISPWLQRISNSCQNFRNPLSFWLFLLQLSSLCEHMPFRGLDTSEIEVRPCLHCLVRKTSQSNSLDQELFPGLLCCVPLSFFTHLSCFKIYSKRRANWSQNYSRKERDNTHRLVLRSNIFYSGFGKVYRLSLPKHPMRFIMIELYLPMWWFFLISVLRFKSLIFPLNSMHLLSLPIIAAKL